MHVLKCRIIVTQAWPRLRHAFLGLLHNWWGKPQDEAALRQREAALDAWLGWCREGAAAVAEAAKRSSTQQQLKPDAALASGGSLPTTGGGDRVWGWSEARACSGLAPPTSWGEAARRGAQALWGREPAAAGRRQEYGCVSN